MPTPEELARENIDKLLTACGWLIQDYKQLDLSAGRGIAIREVRLKEGRCDYLLLIDREPVGIIEAKKAGVTLSTVAFQSGQYAKNLPDFLNGPLTGHLPFLYESTGIETYFRDERDPHPRLRRVFAFHRPETLAKWLEEPDTLRRRLAKMPFAHPYDGSNVRVCRVEAISGLEQSFAAAQPRALIQMATGAGKTLIFCKDHSHAEDVVHISREVFGKGNDFCKKITYQSKHPETGKPANGEQLIQEFRLSPQLRIAVTVDMIATGTDVKPLECLVFLRDVRSRVYFEQMKGRGTRVLSPTDLQAVSGAEARAKTHFFIVDAVGVCESDKTDSRPLDAALFLFWLNKGRRRPNSREDTGHAWCGFNEMCGSRFEACFSNLLAC
jgi:type I site-specific restriction endonuclease